MDFVLSFEALIGSLAALAALFYFFRSLLLETVIYIPEKTRHSWKNLQILNRSCYCSICEILLSDSKDVFCDCCGVAAHNPKCMKRADVYFKCKEKWTKNKSTNHLWVKGNLTHNLVCSQCHEEVDYHGSPGIFGIRCCWCQKSFHDDCFKNYYGDDIKSEKCDFGEFKNLIYPPNSIVAARTPGAVRLHLTEVKKPDYIENWSPLVVIANTKSGSNTATEVVSLLKGYLNPIQVMEISNKGPSEALKLTIKSCPTNTKILVAGGDGTVGWVLNTIKQMAIQPHPSVAIMPLGTGNDLSRVLGWGPEPPSTLDPLKILRNIQNANSIKMDCFDMIIKQHRRLSLPKKSFSSKYQIYNYFSVGVDALVTYNFHKTRESPFYLLSSRLFNKMIYFGYGTQQIIQRDCEGLHDNLDLYIDDKLIELPDLQSIVLLNIDSWGAGCKLVELSNSCDDGDKIEHSISDGKMEVFGVASSFHVAQLQVKLSKPIRLGQGRNIKITLKRCVAVQADGEPWLQKPCDIFINSTGQVEMLQKRY